MKSFRPSTTEVRTCYHCGDTIRGEQVEHDGKLFCCSGCKIVYEILEQNNLCQYYSFEKSPGVQPAAIETNRFDFLTDEGVQKQLLNFSNGKVATVTLNVPSIHCSSCIWLLEHLYRLDAGITSSQVDFLKKQITLLFDETKTSLKNIVVLLASIGYEPELRMDAAKRETESDVTRSLYYKIGIAGFCFGNAMLFSFPEYLGVDPSETALRETFSYLNLLLGIPVFFYCSYDYFTSAVQGLRRGIINIDVPIAIGIVLLFGRSAYEILTHTGAGFIDSLCGLLFFLLLGRVFQSKTYDRLNFERNYKSYFPISVTTKKNGVETTIPISSLKRGDRIVIRNNEIIPADAILLRGTAAVDYSFVTGESTPVEKVLGEMIYAGGRQVGGIIELEVMNDVSQSYLTQLWNTFDAAKKEKGELSELSNTVSKYFTYVVLALATAVGAYWLQYDVKIAINAFTGILIVACPCALAISIPFTLGTTLRIFGRNRFFVKHTSVIESLAKINMIIFDKTGTITHPQKSSVEFIDDSHSNGTTNALTAEETIAVYSVAKNSIHPLSKVICGFLSENFSLKKLPALPADHSTSLKEIGGEEAVAVEQFTETVGKGISGVVNGHLIKIGSGKFAGFNSNNHHEANESRVYLSIDNVPRGYFSITNVYRNGLETIIHQLQHQYEFAVLSGDTESERVRLRKLFPRTTDLRFNLTPVDKLDIVRYFRSLGKRVLMVGDGLNDAGALMQSNVGIAVTEDVAQFTPSSDAILAGDSFSLLPTVLRFSKISVGIVITSFVFAFLYNLVGIYVAVQGALSPVLAAILMPASSITIVVLTTGLTHLFAKREGLL